MRDVMFRARVKRPARPVFGEILPEGTWVYGELHLNARVPHIHDTPISQQPIDPQTVGQFTGCVDSNGNRVFEGDILHHDGAFFGVVVWHPDGYFCIHDGKNPRGVNVNESFRPIGEMMRHYDFEVYSNIHENPAEGGSKC